MKTKIDVDEITSIADRYTRANVFLGHLHDAYRQNLVSTQEARTLRGQALKGDLEGAERGFMKLMRSRL